MLSKKFTICLDAAWTMNYEKTIITIRLKNKTKDPLIMIGHYRQLKQFGEKSAVSTEGNPYHIHRFWMFKTTVDILKDETYDLIVIGDIIVDQTAKNDSQTRPMLRVLQLSLDIIQIHFSLVIVNKNQQDRDLRS